MFSGELLSGLILIFSRQLALNHIARKKTVKISAFCKVTTYCHQGSCKTTLKLVFTKTLKLGKASAVAAAALARQVRRRGGYGGQGKQKCL
jgi:hypothetical protein